MACRRLVPLLALLLPVCAFAQTVREQPVKWQVDDGLCEPETVLHDPVQDLLIVSNICGFKHNGKGYLSLLKPDGTMQNPRWIEDLDAPAGMALRGRRLYVVDYTRIRVVDLDQGRIVDVLEPDPAPGALNDIAIDDDGVIYVSDSARAQVLRIENGESERFPADASFEFANGLHIRGRELFVGGAQLWCVNLDSGERHSVPVAGLSDIDGIEPDGRGGLTLSKVGGRIWQTSLQGEPTIWTAPGVSSTNHAFLPGRKLIVVPTGYDNTIIAFEMD